MVKPKELPPVEELRHWYNYDPNTGLLTVRTPRHLMPEGKVVGSVNSWGYLHFQHFGRTLLVHRVCWKMHYGEEPPEYIDHEKGVKTDNRIKRMRAATCQQNTANRKITSRNNTGVKGVRKMHTKRYGKVYTYYRAQWRQAGQEAGRNFPYTPEGLEAARDFIEEKRRTLYGAFACDG